MHMTTIIVSAALLFLIGSIIYRITKNKDNDYQKEEANQWVIGSAVVLVVAALITVVPAQVGYNATGEGEQSGFITAIEHDGIFHKTTTVYIKTDRESSTYETYCITDSDLVEQLKGYQDSGQRVTISYTKYLTWGKGCEWALGASQVVHSVRAI